MLLPNQRILHTHQLSLRNAQILRRNHMPLVCLAPIALHRKRLQHHRQLSTNLLAPQILILRPRDLHERRPLPRGVFPGLQVLAEGALLRVDEGVLGGRADVRFGQDRGDKGAGVGFGVACVVDGG